MEQHPASRPQNYSQIVAKVEQSAIFAGPIPHPDLLKQYDAIAPGAAMRIIAMAEGQAKHRQDLERTVVHGDDFRANRGLTFGFILALVGLIVALLLGMYGNPWAAGVVGALPISGLGGAFIYGERKRRGERQRQRDALAEAKGNVTK